MNFSFCLYTALSTSSGEFLLNGDFVVTMSKREIRFGNTIIEYSGSDHVVERINSTDRLEEELLLQVDIWPWAHYFILLVFFVFYLQSPGIQTSFPFCLYVPRYCQLENYTTLMCAILSMFQLKTNPNSFIGTVMDRGRHAANSVKVSLDFGNVFFFITLFSWF